MHDRFPTLLSALINTAAVICIVIISAMFIPSADRAIEEFRSAGSRPIPHPVPAFEAGAVVTLPQVAAAPVGRW